uniref:single-stranded DNA cytosine deaminase n=1 Tax=Sus scrofa TaxID=9823 RepID=A0A8D1NWP7_PIG
MDPQRLRQWPGPGPASRGGYGQRPRIRNPEEWFHELSPRTFSFHFRNLRFASGRNRSYICCQVEGKNCFFQGIFQNQVPPDPPCHAELCFLSWFQSWGLSPDEHYYVTWFISWSPCCECAAKVAQFLEENRNVSLSLSAARLYYFWKSESREGLRRLSDLGAQVGIMSFQDFQHCWNNFVHNLGMPFQPWKKLHKNYQRLVTELKQILREEPATYGSLQAQGKVRIGSTAAGLRHSHSHTRSEAHLRPNHSSRQHRILNPPREARARTCVLVDASWICYR